MTYSVLKVPLNPNQPTNLSVAGQLPLKATGSASGIKYTVG